LSKREKEREGGGRVEREKEEKKERVIKIY